MKQNTSDSALIITSPPFPVEVHVAPLAAVDRPGAGLHFDGARAHVHEEEEEAVQQLHGEEVGAGQSPVGPLGLPGGLGPAVAEEQQAVGLRGAEVEGDGAGLLGGPLGQGDVGLRGVEADGVQRGDVLAAEGQVAVQRDHGGAHLGLSGELQPELAIPVHHLDNESHTGRKRDRQTDRQTDRQRERDRQTERERDRQTQTDR